MATATSIQKNTPDGGICSVPLVEYEKKVRPIVSVGGSGSGDGEFKLPYGVAVDCQTGNIYIGDQGNDRVQVFSSEGKLLFKFGDKDGAAKMNSPTCIAIRHDRVFVSQSNAGCVLAFDRRGNFIAQVGMKGYGDGQITTPLGIAFNETNGDFYVCDIGNHRVQIFSEELAYKHQFGHGVVRYPRDVRITKQHIYVLTVEEPFLFLFNLSYARVSQNFSHSVSKHLKCPYAICIDGAGRCLISDFIQNVVIIFHSEGSPIYRLDDASIKQPSGLTIDANGRIVLVSYEPRLLIF